MGLIIPSSPSLHFCWLIFSPPPHSRWVTQHRRKMFLCNCLANCNSKKAEGTTARQALLSSIVFHPRSTRDLCGALPSGGRRRNLPRRDRQLQWFPCRIISANAGKGYQLRTACLAVRIRECLGMGSKEAASDALGKDQGWVDRLEIKRRQQNKSYDMDVIWGHFSTWL